MKDAAYNRFYWNEGLNELRATWDHRESLDRVEYENHWGCGNTCSKDQWEKFKSNAVEVPGLLWHLKIMTKLKQDLESTKCNLAQAEIMLELYMKNYSDELDKSVSHRIEGRQQ